MGLLKLPLFKVKNLIEKAGFSSEVYKEGQIIWQQEEITYAYFLLTRKFD